MIKIYVITLGCPKNLVDSEKIIGIVGSSGYAVTTDMREADYVIVNTCSFIKPAFLEAKSVISKLKKLKEKFSFKIIVAGCLPARSSEDLFKDIDIDGVIGPYDILRMPELINEIEQGKRVNIVERKHIRHYCKVPRVISTWPYAYLKITEGCSNMCSYCTIPSIRGSLVSFSEKEILYEAEFLFQSGIKEIIIVGHDITSYGRDTGQYAIVQLLKKIADIGFPWIRLLYLHPTGITDELLELIDTNSCFCKYLDIPIQHINPYILREMNRPVMDYRKFFEHIRNSIKGVCLRTTLMVGFPGETDRIFEELLGFVKEIRFERLGAFIFSPEKNTKASLMPCQVPYKTKNLRLRHLINVQKEINKQISSSFVHSIVDVIVDEKKNNYFEGRTRMDAPDIDCKVKFKGSVNPGDIVKIRVNKSSPYVLYGKILSS